MNKQTANLIKHHTGGYFNLWNLCGNGKQRARREIILSITGEVKRPLSKCGITELNKLLWDDIKPAGNCYAAKEKVVIKFLERLCDGD